MLEREIGGKGEISEMGIERGRERGRERFVRRLCRNSTSYTTYLHLVFQH